MKEREEDGDKERETGRKESRTRRQIGKEEGKQEE